MVEGDIFREIDDELKREQYAKLWDKYGYLVIGVALAVVLSVAGYKFWVYQQQQQAQKFGTRFMQAVDLERAGDKDKAQLAFTQIAQDGPRGYATLAKLRDAAGKAAKGDTAAAVGEYESLSKDSGVAPVLQQFSTIQAAMLRVDKADEAEMNSRLSAIADGNSSWRHTARELLGLAAFKAGNYAEAEKRYNRILSDQQAPAGVRERAETMISLIVQANAAKPAAAAPAPETKAAPVAAEPAPSKPQSGK
jgi:hypothetical protein